MGQRVAKVESVLQGIVATALSRLLERDAAAVTVTRVDAAPDLHNATVWIGLLGNAAAQDKLWVRLEGARGILQSEVNKVNTMKYAPQLHLRRDTGGEYAAEIDRLLRGL
jgi:ribosome-binding factor A